MDGRVDTGWDVSKFEANPEPAPEAPFPLSDFQPDYTLPPATLAEPSERSLGHIEPKQKFGDAFVKARQSGLKEFEWGGKRYSTETREEAAIRVGGKAKPVSDKPAAAPADDGWSLAAFGVQEPSAVDAPGALYSPKTTQERVEAARRAVPVPELTKELGFKAAAKQYTHDVNRAASEEFVSARAEELLREQPYLKPETAKALAVREAMGGGKADIIEDRDMATQRGIEAGRRQEDMGIGDAIVSGTGKLTDAAKITGSYALGTEALAGAISDAMKSGPQDLSATAFGAQLQDVGSSMTLDKSAREKLGGFVDIGNAILSNPKGFTHFISEQAPNFAAMTAGNLIGWVTGGPAGARAGQAVSEFPLEFGSQLQDRVGKSLNGREATRENVLAALNENPNMVRQALTKAIGTTFIDSVTTVAGQKVAADVAAASAVKARRALGNEASASDIAYFVVRDLARNPMTMTKAVGNGMAVDTSGAAASEIIPQKVAYGEVDAADVIGETLLEPVFGSVGIAGAAVAAGRQAATTNFDADVMAGLLDNSIRGAEFAPLPDAGIGQDGPGQADYEAAMRQAFGGATQPGATTAPDAVSLAPTQVAPPPPSGPVTAALQEAMPTMPPAAAEQPWRNQSFSDLLAQDAADPLVRPENMLPVEDAEPMPEMPAASADQDWAPMPAMPSMPDGQEWTPMPASPEMAEDQPLETNDIEWANQLPVDAAENAEPESGILSDQSQADAEPQDDWLNRFISEDTGTEEAASDPVFSAAFNDLPDEPGLIANQEADAPPESSVEPGVMAEAPPDNIATDDTAPAESGVFVSGVDGFDDDELLRQAEAAATNDKGDPDASTEMAAFGREGQSDQPQGSQADRGTGGRSESTAGDRHAGRTESSVGTAVSVGDALPGSSALAEEAVYPAEEATIEAQEMGGDTQTRSGYSVFSPSITSISVNQETDGIGSGDTTIINQFDPVEEKREIGDIATPPIPNTEAATTLEAALRGTGNPAIDLAAHAAASSPLNAVPEPTEAQKKAGNYAVGRVRLHGMDISIENPAGSIRSGTDSDGERWETEMQSHYGYIRNSTGRDKDHIDVFLSQGADTARTAWVIDQINQDGTFDEHKIVIGPDTEAEARDAYLANYDSGWMGLGAITPMAMDDFKTWVFDKKKTRKPVAYKKPSTRLTAHDDPRIAQYADTLRELASQTGWAQTGGRIYRNPDTGEVDGRTAWIPNAEWYPNLSERLSGGDAVSAVEAAISGASMSVRQKRFVSDLLDVAESYANVDTEDHDPDSAAEAAAERAAIQATEDLIVEMDDSDLDALIDAAWNAEPTERRELSDEEIDELFGAPSEEAPGTASAEGAVTVGQDEGDNRGSDSDGTAGDAEEVAFDLTGQTQEQARAEEQAIADAKKAEQDAADKAEAEAQKARIAAEVASRQQASAENFVLGQDAEDALAGQGDIFGGLTQQEATNEQQSIEQLREKLRKIEGKILLAAGERDNIEQAMSSRKVGKSLKDERNAIRDQVRTAQKRLDDAQKQTATSTETPAGQPDATTAQPAQSKPESVYGTTNTLVTKDRAAELRAKLKSKLGQVNSGIDPEILAIGAELAAYHIEAGARSFGRFAQVMAEDLGASFEKLRPYLRSWFNGARDMLEDAGRDVTGIDGPDVVRAELARMNAQLNKQANALPDGWTEATPGGMAANNDPVNGGIVDSEIVSGKWFAIPNNDAITKIEGMDTRADAFAALQRAINENSNTVGISLSTDEGKFDVAKAVSEHFIAGEGFDNIVAARKFISDITGQKIESGTEAAKRADEAIEVGVVLAARETIAASRKQGRPDGVIFDRLLSIYERQPNLSVRSSSSVRNQAYSTPVPLAFAASRLAGIDANTTVYEPTAGNGMLVIEATQGNIIANEFDPSRADMLRRIMPDATIQTNNAAKWKPARTNQVVIANPPFGAVKDGNGNTIRYDVQVGYSTNEVDHAISFKSLETMPDNGRAVLILGGVDASTEDAKREGYRGKAKREFYFNLYSQYKVTSHYTIDGSLYAKQGAGYPVDVVIIEGRGKSDRDLPAASLPIEITSYAQLKEVLNEQSRMGTQRDVNPNGTDSGNSSSRKGDAQDLAASPGGQGGKDGEVGTEPEASNAGGDKTAESSSGGRPESSGDRAGYEQSGTSNAIQSGGDRQSAVPGKRKQERSESGRNNQSGKPGNVAGTSESTGQRIQSGLKDRRGQEEETSTQVAYNPYSSAPSVGTLVPRNMRDAINDSLNKLQESVGDLDDYVASSLRMETEDLLDNFSAEQIDALALSIKNAEEGKGFIIGDQTGIGKGRVVAAMIKYALVNGKVPIFVTEKPNLYADMIRDLDDIGMSEELGLENKANKILITNGGESIPFVLLRNKTDKIQEQTKNWNGGLEFMRDGTPILFTIETDETVEVVQSLKSPKSGVEFNKLMAEMMVNDSIGDYKAIFTTYSQLQTVKGSDTDRMRFVKHFGEGNYVIFDESHNAGGAGDTQARTKQQREKAKEGKTLVTGRASFVRDMVRASFGSFFSSATYAKRPDVMDLYSSTNMLLAVDSPSKLATAIKDGGVPMQQAVATMLTQDGQYIRRERTFAGVEYATMETKVDKQTAENMASAMRRILAFSRAKEGAIKAMQKDMDKQGAAMSVMGGEKTSVQGANFGSIMHNLIDQMLLSIKAKDSVAFAIDRLKANEKVVMTVSNTMGSFLQSYAEEMEINNGDPVSLSFGDLYQRYLEKQRWVRIKRPGGKEAEAYRLTDLDLGPSLVQMFAAIRKEIQDSEFGSAPISPIDYIHNEIRKAGFSTDEITGRTIVLNYGAAYPTLGSRAASIKQRLEAISGFNNGKTDLLILNQSGSTGLSLHASEKFKDRRKRRMIIVQAEKNIDTHMQMLGRVHRTGQIVAPAYSQMMADVPAEMRPAAVLLKKMAGLNASTTASRTSAVTAEGVVDFMNDYGGQVATEYLKDNPEIHKAIGGSKVIALDDDPAEATEEVIRKFTGYIPILPIAQQEEIYADLIERYNELLDRENSMGTNKLEAKALDLDAETLSSENITPDKGAQSSFAVSAVMEHVDVKRAIKPFSSDEVKAAISETLAGSTAADIAKTQLLYLSENTRAYADTRNAALLADGADVDRIARESSLISAMKLNIENTLMIIRIGNAISITDSNGSVTHGVVTDMKRSGKTKNPAAASAWNVTVALANGDAKSMTIPFSQIGGKYKVQVVDRINWLDPDTLQSSWISPLELFDKGASVRREKRWMVTGNVLAGFALHRGQIVNYTKKDGTTGQGVLMSRSFDFKKVKAGTAVTLTPDKISEFFARTGRGGAITVPDKSLRIEFDGRAYKFSTSSSKRDGGTWFLDSDLTRILETDFFKAGPRMNATVLDEKSMLGAVRYIVDKRGEPLVAQGNADIAREIMGLGEAPKFSRPGKGGRGLPLFSRQSTGGMALRDLKAVAARVQRANKNMPTLHVLASPENLDRNDETQKRLYDFLVKNDALKDVEGATHEGEIYVFASGVADEFRAEHILAIHEPTHYGLRSVYGHELDSVLQLIYASNATVRQKADALKRSDVDSNVGAVEEVLADMTPAELVKLRGWRRLVKTLRDWFREHGFTAIANRLDGWLKSGLTDQAKADLYVADVVNAAREWVKNGKRMGFAADGTNLSATRSGTITVDGVERPRTNSNGKPIAVTDEGLRNFWRWFSPSPGQLLDGLSVAEVSSLKRDTEALADFIESQSGFPEPDRFKVIPSSVFSHVTGVVNNDKILDTVVRSLPVDVVNFLRGKQGTAKDALHDAAMLKKVFSVYPAPNVALGVNPSGIAELLVRVVANTGAKITGLTNGTFERNTAVLADASDPVLGAHVRKSPSGDLGIISGFGDSKVVDDQGRPLVVYHGRNAGSYNPNADQSEALKKEANDIEKEMRDAFGKDENGYRTQLYPTHPKYAEMISLRRKSEETRQKWFVDADLDGAAFDPSRSGDVGVHFTPDPSVASTFGKDGAVFPVYLKADVFGRVGDVFSRYQSLVDAVDEFERLGALDKADADRFRKKAEKLDAKDYRDERDWGASNGVVNFWNDLNAVLMRSENAGFVYRNDVEGGGDSYVVFAATQIKSAIGNSSKFDPTTPNISLSRRGQSPLAAPSLPSPAVANKLKRIGQASKLKNFVIPPETGFRQQQRIFQDSMNRFTVIQDWLAEQGVADLPYGLMDVYRAEERMHGKIASRIEDFREKRLTPLIKRIHKAGFEMAQIAEYLHANHAVERNEQIERINKAAVDVNGDRNGSGMTDAEAAAVLSTYQALPNFSEFEALAEEVRSITDSTKRILLGAGIISQDQADAWDAAYKHYVPLRGNDEGGTASGKGLSVNAKSEHKRAMGHGDRESGEWIVENIIHAHERAIYLAEKNVVGKHLLTLAASVPNADLWTVSKPAKRGVIMPGQVAFAVAYKGNVVASFNTKAEAESFVNQSVMSNTARAKSNYTVNRTVGDPQVVYMASGQLADNEVQVYVKGHAVRIQLIDPLLANAYKRLGQENLTGIMALGRDINNFLSRAYTGLAPEFIVTNVQRDLLSGMVNILGEEGATVAARSLKNWPEAMYRMSRFSVTGNGDPWFNSYRESGGSTGGAYIGDLDRIGREVQATYDEAIGVFRMFRENRTGKASLLAAKKLLHIFTFWIEHMNAAAEGGMRLAAYRAKIETEAKRLGVTADVLRDEKSLRATVARNRAASLAKNSTVNFNRKGEKGAEINANFLFYNAAVQGSAIMAHALVKGKRKGQAWTALATLTGLAALLASQFGDDEWEEIPQHEKDRNMLIKLGDTGYVAKYSVPYGHGLAFAMGNSLHDLSQGKAAGAVGYHMASAVFENLMPRNPLGEDAKSLEDYGWTNFVPEGAFLGVKWWSNIGINRDGFGRQIMPESKYDETQPDHLKMYSTLQGSIYDKITSSTNKATGGTDTQAGSVDVSPETLQFLFESITGGLGRFAVDEANVAKLAAQGSAPEVKEVPVVRKFARERNRASDARSEFWETLGKAEDYIANRTRAVKGNDSAALERMERGHADLSKKVNEFKDAATAIRDSINQKRDDDTLSAAKRREAIHEIETGSVETFRKMRHRLDDEMDLLKE